MSKPRKRGPRVPAQLYPLNLERDYARRLRAFVRDLKSRAMPELKAAIAKASVQVVDHSRMDAAKKPVTKLARIDEIMHVLNGVRTVWAGVTSDFRPGLLAQQVGQRVVAFASKSVKAQVATLITIPQHDFLPPTDLHAWAQRNADLITSIPEQGLDRVRDMILQAFTNGTRSEDLVAAIDDMLTVSIPGRANLIARDQIAKLNGQVTRSRQQGLGVTSYVWRTSLDERVRGNPAGKYPNADPSHWALEGQVFSWASGGAPDVGHPGEDYQCRCRAEPVLGDLIGTGSDDDGG